MMTLAILFRGRFITSDNIIREHYEYDDKGNLVKYTFANPKQPGIKYETSEFDDKGRTVKTTSFGFLNTPELISHYIFPDSKSKRCKYKHVTKADGSLLMTFYYTYDTDKDDSNLTGLFGFYLTPKEIDQLLKDYGMNNEWEKGSVFRSKWKYTRGKQTFYERDELIQPHHRDYGLIEEDERIVTDRSEIYYDDIEGKEYPVKIIDWQTRYMEPCNILKEYSYSDESGNKIYPLLPENNAVQNRGNTKGALQQATGKSTMAKKAAK